MLNAARTRAQDQKGFTLIELLVVILIIGILAAIALPAFLSQRGKAQDTEAKSQVRMMQTAEESVYAAEQSYQLGDLPKLKLIEPSLNSSKATPSITGTPNSNSFTVVSTSASGNVFTIEKRSTAIVTRSCTTGGSYGCPTSGSW